METMKAIQVHQFGGPEVLMYEDVSKPRPMDGDVLLQVEAAGVNPGEAKIRQGLFAEYHPLPFILGYDLAGTIAEIGANGTGFAVGDRVYTSPESTRSGGYAEFVAVRASEIALRPKTLDANLLRQDKTTQRGLKAKSKKASWDNEYLLRLLLQAKALDEKGGENIN